MQLRQIRSSPRAINPAVVDAKDGIIDQFESIEKCNIEIL